MKSKVLLSIAAIAMALVLAFSAGAPAALHAAQKKHEEAGERERHPEIRAAINALEKAKAHLTLADHDFGGHRADAVKACDEAIKELNEALKFDKH
jgi:ABC-type glycerol-3-phosphate transport system substrate-binding protein